MSHLYQPKYSKYIVEGTKKKWGKPPVLSVIVTEMCRTQEVSFKKLFPKTKTYYPSSRSCFNLIKCVPFSISACLCTHSHAEVNGGGNEGCVLEKHMPALRFSLLFAYIHT